MVSLHKDGDNVEVKFCRGIGLGFIVAKVFMGVLARRLGKVC